MALSFRALGPHPVELQLDAVTHTGTSDAPGTRWLGCIAFALILAPMGVSLLLFAWTLLRWAAELPALYLVDPNSLQGWLYTVVESPPARLALNAPELVVLPPLLFLIFLGPPIAHRLRRTTVRVDDVGLHTRAHTVRWEDVREVLADNVQWGDGAGIGASAVHSAVILVHHDGTRHAWTVRSFVEADTLAVALEQARRSRQGRHGVARPVRARERA